MNETLKNNVIETLKTIFDPEIPVNIYDLGLIYELDVTDDGIVHILMTLTSPNCPMAEDIPPLVQMKVQNVHGIKEVSVELTFEPPWDFDQLSDEAKLELGLL
ncbi:MAG: SUF system Fe-S cluster assembly protein [Bacteroidales bacterium]|nr:SUF system Fe-S cluster assembly protein [Bacteroidales bacterium]